MIEQLITWENSSNQEIIAKARVEILKSTNGNPPPVLDPFCGGGSIPLEAQRLGLEAHGSDLNPVAVLISKALFEIPPKFAGRAPVNPEAKQSIMGLDWHGAQGLADDIRYYGKWMRNEAEQRIGHLYPKVTLPKELGGGEATVIAWLWARTVTCPNPACKTLIPLTSKWWLSKKRGKEVWIKPIIDSQNNSYSLQIHTETPTEEEINLINAGTKAGRGAKFICPLCGLAVAEQYLKSEIKKGHSGTRLLSIVAEGKGRRIYLPSTTDQENIADQAKPLWYPDQHLADDPRNIWCVSYGIDTFAKLFTPRQLEALTTFSDMIQEARDKVLADAKDAGMAQDNESLNDGGVSAIAYADAVATYLAIAIDRSADYWSALCSWHTTGEKVSHTFTRQAIPMVWDFTEANPLSNSSGNILGAIDWIANVIKITSCNAPGEVKQRDAMANSKSFSSILISTDPPYYDNIGYADLSDFFYVWLRRSLNDIYPELFGTMLVPKAGVPVADGHFPTLKL